MIRFKWWLILFGILTLIFGIIAIDNSNDFIFTGSSTIVVILVMSIRLLDGFLSPLIFRDIGQKFPQKSENMGRWIAATEKVTTFIAIWITYSFVESGLIS